MGKFPDHAKMVFEGKLFKIFQWEQILYDGSKTIFEGIKRKDSAMVVAIYDGKICYLKQSQPHMPKPFYGMIGGQVEENEDPLTAARREMLEEAGLASDNWCEFFKYDPFSKMDWTIHWFIAKDCYKVAEISPDAGEKIEVCLATFEEFMQNIMPRDDYRDKDLKARFFNVHNTKNLLEFKQLLGLD